MASDTAGGNLGQYVTALEAALDGETVADLIDERRRDEIAWLAARALAVATDDTVDIDFRLGYARSAVGAIRRRAPRVSGRRTLSGYPLRAA